MLYPVAASILSAVMMLPQNEEALCRAVECFFTYHNVTLLVNLVFS